MMQRFLHRRKINTLITVGNLKKMIYSLVVVLIVLNLDQKMVKAFAQTTLTTPNSGCHSSIIEGNEVPETCQVPETSVDSSSSKSSYPLQEVKNFRDIATSSITNRFQFGKFYRTGSVSRATEDDARYLREVVGIKTFLDLRSDAELWTDPSLNGSIYVNYQNWKYVDGSYLPYLNTSEPSENNPITNSKGYRYFVSLMSEDLIVKSLVKRLDLFTKAKVILLAGLSKISSRANKALRQMFLEIVNDGGLYLLNELVLEISGKEIVEVLKLLADPKHHPVAMYCTAGKDRTGIIAMMFLSILGATDEEIQNDYKISDTVYKDMNDNKAVVASLQQSDVKTDVFLRATPDIIQYAMDFVRSKYGSIDNYLDQHGFDETWRDRLRTQFLK